MKPQKNKWWQALKIIISLTIFGFFISIFISLFIEDDFESLDGNVAVIDISGPIVAQKDTKFLFEEVTSSDEIRKLSI